MNRAIVALVALSACFRGGDVVEPTTVHNVASRPQTLRIERVPPVVGMVRVESTISRGRGVDSRKVIRVATLAVDGFASVKEKITYLEATGAEAALAGKSFIITRVDDQIEVVPTDGTPPGDEEVAREDNKALGEIDSTVLMVTNRDFVVGKPVKVPASKDMPPGAGITLTLRTFDAATATFDLAVTLPDMPMLVSARGHMVVERATGLDRSALLTMKLMSGRSTVDSTIEYQATTE